MSMYTDQGVTVKQFFKQIGNGVFLSFSFTLIFLIFMSGIVFFSSFAFSDSLVHYALLGIHFFSVFFGSFVIAHYAKCRGMLLGILVGFFYTLIAGLLGLGYGEGALGILSLLNRTLLAIVAGIIGGILGVNM